MQEINTQNRSKLKLMLDISLLIIFFTVVYGCFAIFLPMQERFEAKSLLILQDLFRTHHWLTPTLNGAKVLSFPPLFYWLAGGWSKLFGLGYLQIRLLSIILALLNITLLYLTSRYVLRRGVAIVASIILACSFLFACVATLTAPLQLTLLITSAVFYSFILVMHCKQEHIKWFSLVFWVSLGLLVMTDGVYLAGLVALGIVIFILCMGNQTAVKRIHSLRGYIIFCAIALPWFVYASIHNPYFLQFYFIDLPLQHIDWLTNNKFIPNWLMVIVILLGFLPWTAFLMNAIWYNKPSSWHKRHEEPLGIFLMVMAGIFIVGLSLVKVSALWGVLILPLLALMCGRYIAAGAALKRLPLKNTAVEVLFLFVFIVLTVIISFALKQMSFTQIMRSHFYQYLLGYITISAAITLLTLRFSSLKKGFVILAIFSILNYFVGGIIIASHYRDQSRVENIARYILANQKKGEVVASYQNLPYPISLMLNKNMVLIDWKNPPAYAERYQDNNQWLTSESHFWNVMKENKKKAFIIIPKGDFLSFISSHKGVKLIMSSEDLVLLSIN